MPLKIPNLDDRNFSDLVKEGISLLPQYAPQWTNHNPSDPGITLIELLAYVTEILIYRLNRVTRDNKTKFLKLLRNLTPEEMMHLSHPDTPAEAIDEALRETILRLREPQRAVTVEDYEQLTKRETTEILKTESRKVRTRCFFRLNLETADPKTFSQDRPGHVSVVIVPERNLDTEEFADLLGRVREALEPMRLLTTQLHVVKPFFVRLSLGITICPKPGASQTEVQHKTVVRLQDYFSPSSGGGPKGEGWPFGRPVYFSEIYSLLEEIEGVDYIGNIRILNLAEIKEPGTDQQSAFGIQIGVRSTVGIDTRLGGQALIDKDRIMRDKSGRLIGIRTRAYELVRITMAEDAIVFS